MLYMDLGEKHFVGAKVKQQRNKDVAKAISSMFSHACDGVCGGTIFEASPLFLHSNTCDTQSEHSLGKVWLRFPWASWRRGLGGVCVCQRSAVCGAVSCWGPFYGFSWTCRMFL